MMRSLMKRGIVAAAVLSLLLAGSATAAVQQGYTSHSKAAAGANTDWPRFGNTTDNTRFSPLTQIDASNVGKLGVAWTMQEGPGLSTWETYPVVVNGVMYITTNTDQVRAVDPATGKLMWQYSPKVNFYEAIAGGGGGVPTNRGVEVAGGRVYLLTFDNQLIALQASTGEKLWSSQVADPVQGYSETSPPTFWNGLLFVGSAESDAGMRGFVAAFDAATGKQVWRFYTVPDVGHGWMPAVGAHGGGDVWMPQLIDTTTGILYFGTGNPSPDLDNSNRPGCNPWVDALVALDARTGKFMWAHTEVCNDVWDYDSMQPPMLFNMTVNGQTVRAVGHANKSGLYFVYDAKTGKVLAQSPHLGPWTVPHLKPTVKGSFVCPNLPGATEYSPPAYSPITESVFQAGINSCVIVKLAPKSETALHKRGAVDLGGSIKIVGKSTGFMAAVDVHTGHIMWKTPIAKPMIGGSLATAGNLVFSGADDQRLYAFNAQTGKVLWNPDMGLGYGAAPIAYQVNGTEYIAIAAGGGNVGGFLGTGAKTGGTLVVFKLNGKPIKPLPALNSGFIPNAAQRPSVKGLAKVNPWMYVDAKRQHVVIMMVAAATPTNNGFNFDGYANGKANFIVPQGWTVDWIFSNASALPHSAGLVTQPKSGAQPIVLGLAPIETANALQGINAKQEQYISFNTVTTGKFYLACLVPGHIQSGMWDVFTISPTAKMPSIVAK